MARTIAPVQEDHIKHAMFIDLTLGGTTYYISSAYKPITYNSNTYTELGAFLQLGEIQEDIKTTNGDIGLRLNGIPSDNDYISLILGSPVKGGEVVVYRGFFNDDLTLDSANVFQRFKGVITNFAIEEDVDILEGIRTNSVSVSCSSIVTVLENKTSGQRTSPIDRDRVFPGDQTFKRVPDLQFVQFDFGREFNGTGGSGGGGGRRGGGGGRDRGGGGGRNQQLR
jgi:uncharacterized membrane protein YgcG